MLDEATLKDAGEFATLLVNERFEAATDMFEPALVEVMDARKLEAAWRASAKQRGTFRRILEVRGQAGTRQPTVLVVCEFEKVVMNLEVRLGSTRRVLTFYLHRRPA